MLRVLTYHRVAEPENTPELDPTLVSATPDVFREQMLHVKRRYRPVSLDDVIGAFRLGRPLPDRAVHVTVDDAYRDFGEMAWPILRELDIPVTVFVPTGYPDRPDRAFWWDRLHRAESGAPYDSADEALPARCPELAVGAPKDVRTLLRTLPHDVTEAWVDSACGTIDMNAGGVATRGPAPVLSWDELRQLRAEGVTFGAHTRHHVALSRVDPARARREIRASLDDLSRELGDGPLAIAYPYGMHDEQVARMAEEEGCVLGFTCEDGLSRPGRTDPFRLRRTNITPRTTPALFALRMLPWFAAVDRWRHRHERELLAGGAS